MTPREQGRFVPGVSYSPDTQFKAGERRSPRTEFSKGQAAHNRLPVGAVRARIETHTGLRRDSLNDAPENIVALTREAHIEEHRGEFPCRT